MQLLVLGHTSLDLILYNQHTQLFKLLPSSLMSKHTRRLCMSMLVRWLNTLRLPCTYSSNAAATLWASASGCSFKALYKSSNRYASPTFINSHTKNRYGRLRISSFYIWFHSSRPCPCFYFIPAIVKLLCLFFKGSKDFTDRRLFLAVKLGSGKLPKRFGHNVYVPSLKENQIPGRVLVLDFL